MATVPPQGDDSSSRIVIPYSMEDREPPIPTPNTPVITADFPGTPTSEHPPVCDDYDESWDKQFKNLQMPKAKVPPEHDYQREKVNKPDGNLTGVSASTTCTCTDSSTLLEGHPQQPSSTESNVGLKQQSSRPLEEQLGSGSEAPSYCYKDIYKAYKLLITSIADNLSDVDVSLIVFLQDVPQSHSSKALHMMQYLEKKGKFSCFEIEPMEQLLRDANRYDLITKYVTKYKRLCRGVASQGDQKLRSSWKSPCSCAINVCPPVDYIRGVDVIAETRFVLTKGAQSFEWEEHGFKLHVPEGSLPEGLDQCEVKVKVSLSGNFDLPESSELVSAVYWVYSPHLFLEPLTVEIQHCAAITTPTQCTQLTFIRTKCTQKELPYSFKELDGGSFEPNSPYGSIPVTHFSGIGIAKKSIRRSSSRNRVMHVGRGSRSRSASSSSRGTRVKEDVRVQYCGLLYTFKELNDWMLHFVVVKDLKTCLQVVGKYYSTFAREKLSISTGFESDKICLDLPEDGAQLMDDWKIYPCYDPTVTKYDVDLFTSGKRIPKCEMVLVWENKSLPPKRVQHKIGLRGARGHTFFLLVVDPGALSEAVPTSLSETLPSKADCPKVHHLKRLSGRGGRTVKVGIWTSASSNR